MAGARRGRRASHRRKGAAATFRFAERVAPGATACSSIMRQDLHPARACSRSITTRRRAASAPSTPSSSTGRAPLLPGWDEPQFAPPTSHRDRAAGGRCRQQHAPGGRAEPPDGPRSSPSRRRRRCHPTSSSWDRRFRPDHHQCGRHRIGVVTSRRRRKGRWRCRDLPRCPWYNDYFGTAYPLPTRQYRRPGSSQFFGAMENWGAIFSFESILLVDPAITTEAAGSASSKSPPTKSPTNGSATGHHGVVGRSLAERGLRLVDGDQVDSRAPPEWEINIDQ